MVNLLARLTARPHSSETGRLDFAVARQKCFPEFLSVMAAPAARQLRLYQSHSSRIEPAISRYRLTFGVALHHASSLADSGVVPGWIRRVPAGQVGNSSLLRTEISGGCNHFPYQETGFTAEIKPIFQARCQPCHFPGGKVYDRMPFDKPETITRLGTKLFTRIKDEKEQRLIRVFLAP